MSDEFTTLTCQQCGAGFILTSTYRDFLRRRGVQVVEPVLCPTCFVTKGPLPKIQGTVKWFSPKKRYGFIVSRDGEEIFFHEQQLLNHSRGKLPKGQKVSFHVRYPFKGPEALNVEVVSG